MILTIKDKNDYEKNDFGPWGEKLLDDGQKDFGIQGKKVLRTHR